MLSWFIVPHSSPDGVCGGLRPWQFLRRGDSEIDVAVNNDDMRRLEGSREEVSVLSNL